VSRALKAAAFASGGGTNLQALIDHQNADTPWTLSLLVCNLDGAGVLQRADAADVMSAVIPTKDRDEESVATDTIELLEQHDIEVIFLCGYLRKIPSQVVERFPRRILNVHPALLPAFGGSGMYGINVHRAVIDSGARISGPTIHYVDEQYDNGTIVTQWPVPVKPADTPEELAARVLEAEHRLYPIAADHVCNALAEGRDPGPLMSDGNAYRLCDELL
jgi:formyltetrahydrofolate-dependent phosphoribosylglycinamide formyltransferase